MSLELWSFNLVYRHCVSSKFLYTEICSAADLRQLLQVCQLTPDLDIARCRLLTQIIERNLVFRAMYDSESPLDDADALAIAQDFGLISVVRNSSRNVAFQKRCT